MIDWLGDKFRKLSWVALAVGVLAAFYTLLFADYPLDRAGRPKPPLGWQLLRDGAVIASGVPGAAWGVVRAVRGRQRTFWE